MAFIKAGGGNDGIAEYLREGKKQGREKHRDEIDHRVILDGDLDICDRIIQSRESDGERYDHLTVSFSEDNLTPEKLREISDDIKAFVTAAYGKDELYYYAEAHYPKTATEEKWNSETKRYETVDRFVHFHVVIPKVNLVTGGYAAPLDLLTAKYGSKDATRDFLYTGLQEHINQKHGLTSPKDHRRTGFTGKADMLERIKEDQFTGRNREALSMIRERMLDEGIESPEAFREMLEKMGTVTEGRGGDYLQIRLPGETQNVRLKDYQFSNEFVSLPMREKIKFYEQRIKTRSPEKKAKDDARVADLMQKWPERAREIKYLSPSSKTFERYKLADAAGKRAILDDLEAAHYAKLERDYGFVDEARGEALRTRAADIAPEQRAELDANLEAVQIERFTNARLNSAYLRTSEEYTAAEKAGQQIIENPQSVIAQLTFSQSHFSEAALERHLLKNTAGQEQYEAALRAVLACPELVVHHDEDGNMQFTSAEIVAIESSLMDRTERMAANRVAAISKAQQDEISDARPFNPGQREAFRLLCSNRQIAVVNGAAGTGKSFVLAAMREAYAKEGFKVYGAILQGKTAEDLERDSGIESRTIARMLIDLDNKRLTLDDKSVIVIDEAGMVGSRDLEKLMGYVEAAGARLRLVGDAAQLAAVEYGNAFVEISNRVELRNLDEIMRQNEDWMREASKKFSRLEIEGLQDYIDHGRAHLADTKKDAQIQLVAAWNKHRAEHFMQSRVVLAHTNADRIALNDLMRAELKKEGNLKNEVLVATPRGTVAIGIGEYVMFTRPNHEYGVKNGTTGTVTKISERGDITVRIDGEREAIISHYDATITGVAIDHAYAVTVHKSQGMTVDKTFALADKGMTLENLGVAMTRHRHDVELFASEEQFKDLDAMVRDLDRTGFKAFTADKEWQSAERPADSVVGQYIADMNAEKMMRSAARTAGYKEIAANLEIKRVLDYASKEYGIDPEKYPIVTDEQGRQRIQTDAGLQDGAGFLTKTLHLNYHEEAAPILKQCYGDQLVGAYSEPRRAPGQTIDQSMLREFSAHVKARDAQYRAMKEAIDQTKREQTAAIAKSTAPVETKKQAQAELTKAIKAEKKALRAEHEKPTAEIYKDFLAARAPTSAKHLQELSRVSTTPADKERLALVKEQARGITPDLSHLSAAQLNQGVNHVIARSPKPPAAVLARGAGDIGRPADHIVRTPTHSEGIATEAASGLHDMPAGRVDAPRHESGVLLPDAVPGRLGDGEARQDQDVRRTGASADRGGNGEVVKQNPATAHRIHLSESDRELLSNIEKSMAAVHKDRDNAIPALASRLKNLDATIEKAHEDAMTSRQAQTPFNEEAAMKKAVSLRVTDAEIEVNRLAKERGINAIPFPQPGDKATDGYDFQLGRARSDLQEHQRFASNGRADQAETARLKGNVDKWEKESAWSKATVRDIAVKLAPRDAERIAKMREQDAAHKTTEQARTQPARDRAAALEKERDRFRTGIAKKFSPEKQKQLEKAMQLGIERSR